MRRRSPYEIMAEIRDVVENEDASSVNAVSRKVKANWLTCRKVMNTLKKPRF